MNAIIPHGAFVIHLSENELNWLRYNQRMIARWIYEENILPWLETIANFVGYKFDEWDWNAVNFGIQNTNVEEEKWYEYQLIGNQIADVKIAIDVGASVMFVQLQSEKSVEEKAQVATEIFQNYLVKVRVLD